MKYIDADLLRKEIDKWVEAMADAIGDYSDGVRFALEHFTFVLDSLQQEQPEVDLEKETRRWWKEHLHLNPENQLWMDAHQSVVFASYFYELGKNSK